MSGRRDAASWRDDYGPPSSALPTDGDDHTDGCRGNESGSGSSGCGVYCDD